MRKHMKGVVRLYSLWVLHENAYICLRRRVQEYAMEYGTQDVLLSMVMVANTFVATAEDGVLQ